MSIRHMDDLRRIRPSIQFILENYLEIFDKLTSNEAQMKGINRGGGALALPAAMLARDYSDGITHSPSSSHAQRKKASALNEHPSQQLYGDSTTEIRGDNMSSGKGAFFHKASHTQPHDFESIEWKLLEALVSSRIKTFLATPTAANAIPPSLDSITFQTSEAASRQNVPFAAPENAEGKVAGAASEDSNEGAAEFRARTLSGPKEQMISQRQQRQGSGIMTQRRLQIAECKAIKLRIAKFEQEWLSEHGRYPKVKLSFCFTVWSLNKQNSMFIRMWTAPRWTLCTRHIAI